MIWTYQYVSCSKITMNNVVCVKMQQSTSDAFDQSNLIFRRVRCISVEYFLVKTATATVFQHNTRQCAVNTDAKCLHNIRVRRECTKTRTSQHCSFIQCDLTYIVSVASSKNPSMFAMDAHTLIATFAPCHCLRRVRLNSHDVILAMNHLP